MTTLTHEPAQENEQRAARPVSPWQRLAGDFFASKLATLGLAVFVTIALLAVFAPLISPQDPYDLAQLDIMDSRLPPGEASTITGMVFYLGSDDQGRDLLSGILYGLRISLMVGATSTAIALFHRDGGGAAGRLLRGQGGHRDHAHRGYSARLPRHPHRPGAAGGAGAGHRQGHYRVDRRPVGLLCPHGARHRTGGAEQGVHRGGPQPGVEPHAHRAAPSAAQLHAAPDRGGHGAGGPCHRAGGHPLLPRAGAAHHRASLGLLIANGYEYLLSGKYWISVFPGIALLVTIVSINLMGDQLRDVLNPRLQK